MECPRCSTDIGHDVNYCRSCGLPVGKLKRAVRDWNCPRCEIEFEGRPTVCDECGLQIGKLRERLVTVEQRSSGPPPDDESPGAGPARTQADTALNESKPVQKESTGRRPAASTDSGSHPPPQEPDRQPGQPNEHGQQPGQPGQPKGHGQKSGQPNGSDRQPAQSMGPDQTNRPRQQVPRTQGLQSQAHGTFSRLPVIPAVVAGFVAYGINYIMFLLLVNVEFPDLGESTSLVGKSEFAGWFLYNAHQVEIEGTVTGPDGTTSSETVNYLVEAYSSQSTTVPDFLYYLVPMVVLYVAALFAVRLTGTTVDRWKDGAAIGVPLAAGYSTATLLGALTMFSVEATSSYGGGSESLQPELFPALLVMGVIYPVVVGGIAGAIGSRESLF